MTFISSLFAFIITIGVLVTIHEWGHFVVARLCGVKVLRFSVGFGPVLFSRVDKLGTEYCISAVPLGGYVKMLGEDDESLSNEDLSFSFALKPAWQRMCIVAAGPFINLAFAFVVFWVFFSVGSVTQLIPVIDRTIENSPAHLAQLESGSEIIAIDGEPVSDWSEIAYALINRVGDTGSIEFELQREGRSSHKDIVINSWISDEEPGDVIRQLGLVPFIPSREAKIAAFTASSPAAAAGLLVGDKVLSIDDQAVASWMEMAEIVQKKPARELQLQILRGEALLSVMVVPLDDNGVGKLGIYAPELPASSKREKTYSVVGAVPVAWEKTTRLIKMSLVSMVKMVQGKIGINNLSGPITIAKVAGESANRGVQSFVQFLAFFSVMLGVLNLLPIPALDGGHLFFYTWEAIAGKAVPEKIQHYALMTGLAFLLSLMTVAIVNDVLRLMV